MSCCISPIKIKSPLAGHNKKHIYVPCGKCAWCRRQKRNEWCLRFQVEQDDNLFTSFVTLTYSDDHLPFNIDESTGEVKYVASKTDIQKFIKRLRKAGYKFKYFLVSELGPKNLRPHYHALFFSNDITLDNAINDKWEKGFTTCLPATAGAMRYVTKYILKGNDRDDNFMLCSKRPAIGSSYIKQRKALQCYRKTDDGTYNFLFPAPGGNLLPMPSYYKRKFKQFFDELDFELNKFKIITNMETAGKFDRLEDKFRKLGYQLPRDKLLEFIKVQYDRDNLKQIDINNKDKL